MVYSPTSLDNIEILTHSPEEDEMEYGDSQTPMEIEPDEEATEWMEKT